MAIGIGGSTPEQELSKLTNMTADVNAISLEEYQQRIAKAQQLMQEQNIEALYINAGTNLSYFTGTDWHSSERLVGALLPANGDLVYIAPWFEQNTLDGFMTVKAPVIGWHEHESPTQLVIDLLVKNNITQGTISVDESTAFFTADGFIQTAKKQGLSLEFVTSKAITAGCRAVKSTAELALLQRAKDMTMEVHKAVARILKPGITVAEVTSFIYQAHIKVGAEKGFSFCIVLFGGDTA